MLGSALFFTVCQLLVSGTCSIRKFVIVAPQMWPHMKLLRGKMPFPAHLHGARFDHIKGMPDVALADDLTAFSKELFA